MRRSVALGCALLLFGAVGCSKKDKARASQTSALASASAAAPADPAGQSGEICRVIILLVCHWTLCAPSQLRPL